jgi:hypothetical protein
MSSVTKQCDPVHGQRFIRYNGFCGLLWLFSQDDNASRSPPFRDPRILVSSYPQMIHLLKLSIEQVPTAQKLHITYPSCCIRSELPPEHGFCPSQ